MNPQDRIRKRQSYQEFSRLLTFFNKNPKPSTFLKRIHATIDKHRGFKYETNSYYAMESLRQLIKDKKLR